MVAKLVGSQSTQRALTNKLHHVICGTYRFAFRPFLVSGAEYWQSHWIAEKQGHSAVVQNTQCLKRTKWKETLVISKADLYRKQQYSHSICVSYTTHQICRSTTDENKVKWLHSDFARTSGWTYCLGLLRTSLYACVQSDSKSFESKDHNMPVPVIVVKYVVLLYRSSNQKRTHLQAIIRMMAPLHACKRQSAMVLNTNSLWRAYVSDALWKLVVHTTGHCCFTSTQLWHVLNPEDFQLIFLNFYDLYQLPIISATRFWNKRLGQK